MPTEYAGIPRDSVVAQQVHHAEHVAERIPQPEPAPVAAVVAGGAAAVVAAAIIMLRRSR